MSNKRKDIAVIGIGRFGQTVVEELINLKVNVLALDIIESKLTQVSRLTTTAILDAADIEALKSIGIDQFGTVIIAASDNIEIAAALVELGVDHIIAKAKNSRHERVLKQIGVDVIVKPEIEAGIRTALMATNTNFIRFNSRILQEVGDGYAIGATVANNKNWIDIKIADLPFKKYEISIVTIERKSKIFIPSGDFILEKGDTLTVIGKLQSLAKFFAEINDNEYKVLHVKRNINY